MHIQCQTVVDHVIQARKSTRPNKKGFMLFRDGRGMICLAIGDEKTANPTIFKLENKGIGKIYSAFVGEGKCSLELNLPGGGKANVLISGGEPSELKHFTEICQTILQFPEKAHELRINSQSFGKKKPEEDEYESESDDE
ncbi:hypothetical protein CYY_005713 [Polysphondylium violaceum]|uniref:PIF1/LRR1 pleckstrin homology domain-containing protein n=1 Tax=Polysphondylium violaceum TaxID=133409 RepID=A0A8J4UZG0_9MYCE|nr:hypothetical protein CYY_005713 [Polysphondylium violaceum]